MKLGQKFYNQPTLKVAQQLLGKVLVRKVGGKEISALITETEAYIGQRDQASHACRGRTRRTEVMFGPAGHWYIYLIYGMYYCLNIVTEKDGYPAAVLIRAARSLDPKISYQLTNGPGKLCRYLKIDKTLNNSPSFGSPAKLYITKNGLKVKPAQIKRGKRIGIDYAGAYKDKLWRFCLK